MKPTYSAEGKNALPFVTFKSYDLFVYFEDEGAEGFYEEVLTRLGVDKSRARVVCLSGKASLLDHRSHPKNRKLQSKILYVLDKDFDDFLGTMITADNIFYLPRYSIENFLLDPEAILDLVREEKPRHENPAQLLKIQEYLESQRDLLTHLTVLYLLAQEHRLPIPNTSEPIQRRARDRQPWFLCAEKIAQYQQDLEALLMMLGQITNEAGMQQLMAGRKACVLMERDSPGKQLLDLIRFHLGNVASVRGISEDSFSYRLARKSKLEDLRGLRGAIERRGGAHLLLGNHVPA